MMKYIILIVLFLVPINIIRCEDRLGVDTAQITIDTLVSDTTQAITADEQPSSTWEQYIEPAVAVIAAAFITIFFFSVRSKQ